MVRILGYRVAIALAVLALIPIRNAHADLFDNVYYDSRTDELVVTMRYSGTNPNHDFSLKWGECRPGSTNGSSSINADVTDSQWQDVEQHEYVKTTRFPLTSLTCRPAKVTLFTPPRFEYVVFVPARQ
jgi:hypothetical protein